MKKIIYSLVLLFAINVLIVSCNEDEINFDYNSYTPVLKGDINGPGETFASGLAPVTYTVTHRGGSTYTWTVTGAGATITQNEQYPSIAYITFDQSDVDIPGAIISCTETASSGISSNTLTKTVNLKKFKAMSWDDFVGTWTGTENEDGGGDVPITFNITKGSETNSIVLASPGGGVPAVMRGIFDGWGESFQAGFGLEGDVILYLNLETGSVDVNCAYWGQTLPGPWDYWLSGSGTWDGVTETIYVEFGMEFDDSCSDDYNHTILEITKQ